MLVFGKRKKHNSTPETINPYCILAFYGALRFWLWGQLGSLKHPESGFTPTSFKTMPSAQSTKKYVPDTFLRRTHFG